MGEPKIREDVNATASHLGGLKGAAETFLRRFRNVSYMLFLTPLVVLCATCLGVAAGAGLAVFEGVRDLSISWHPLLKYLGLGCGLAFGFLTYGMCLIFIVPAANFCLPRIKPFRGPWYSLPAIPWFAHNALTYIVRFTFLEFVTPSPINILFYRMMGMKIGKGVMINTTHISDPSLIVLEDFVTVGGSATICAHYGQRGYLIIAPVVIGRGSNIGLKASVMGGVKVGREVTVKPHTVLLPKTQVPDGEVV